MRCEPFSWLDECTKPSMYGFVMNLMLGWLAIIVASLGIFCWAKVLALCPPPRIHFVNGSSEVCNNCLEERGRVPLALDKVVCLTCLGERVGAGAGAGKGEDLGEDVLEGVSVAEACSGLGAKVTKRNAD